MNEMIDRAARAIMDKSYETCSVHAIRDEESVLFAIEVIKAIREPTDAMVRAAMTNPHPSVAQAGGIIEQGMAAVKIDYQAMIEEMLK